MFGNFRIASLLSPPARLPRAAWSQPLLFSCSPSCNCIVKFVSNPSHYYSARSMPICFPCSCGLCGVFFSNFSQINRQKICIMRIFLTMQILTHFTGGLLWFNLRYNVAKLIPSSFAALFFPSVVSPYWARAWRIRCCSISRRLISCCAGS